MNRETPRLADRFLRWFCKPSLLEDIQGDLEEYYWRRVESEGVRKARRQYYFDVIRFLKPYVIRKPRTILDNPFKLMKSNFVFALRALLKYRLISILNLVGLVTGITSVMFISLWVINETTFDAFHSKADRIFRVPNTFESKSESFTQAVSGPALGFQIPDNISGVEAATRLGSMWYQIGTDPVNSFQEKRVLLADPNFFEVFSFNVLKGSATEALKDNNSIVITPEMAIKYFGTEDAINKTLLLSGERPMKVTAIAETPPTNSQIQFDFVIPMDLVREFWNWETMNETWIGGAFHTYLLLNPGASPEQIEKEVNDLVWEKSGDEQKEMDVKYSYFLQPLTSIHLESDLRYDHSNNGSLDNVYIFSVVGLVILLLASVNYINLIAANSSNRAKEVGLKKVMGAVRSQLISHHLLESVVMVLVASGVSLLILKGLMFSFEDFTQHKYSNLLDVNFFLSVASGSIVLGILAGLYPAFILSAYNPVVTLKGNFKKSEKGVFLRKFLIILQFTATVTLIISIFIISRQMQFINQFDLGMEHSRILYVNVENPDPLEENFQAFRNELLKVPGVVNVSGHSRAYPVAGLSNGITMVENNEGEMVSSSLYHMWVDNNYQETYGLKMIAGRFFSDDFPADSTNSILVNEAAIDAFGWESPENAIGKKFGQPPYEREVIGVINNFNFETLKKKVEPVRILPVRHPTELSIAINTSDPIQLLSNLEDVWDQLLPGQPLDARFMSSDLEEQYQSEYKFRTIFALFSTLSIIIASLGLFGLVTFTVQLKIKEIGIRKLLGASSLGILGLINKQFLFLIIISVVIAIPISYLLMDSWLSDFAYRTTLSISDFLFGSLLAVGIAVVTMSYQSLKAIMSNLYATLKEE